MNKRYIPKHDFSKSLKVCRNTKKVFFTDDNVSIVKKKIARRGCGCENADVQHTLKFECTECINEAFIEHSQFHHIRSLFYTMILASIIVSYIFTWVRWIHGHEILRLSNNIFNTQENFISISILGSFFRVPEYRH